MYLIHDTVSHAPQLMIKRKKSLPLTFQRHASTRQRSGKALVRRVKFEPSLTRVYNHKRFRTNADVFGLLQDIEAEILSSTNSHPAENSFNGTPKACSDASPLESLPLSPLMHPQLLAARRRYTEAKPPPSKKLTDFQSLLDKNPYAKILASPVRSCILTGARLPRSLCLSFTIQNHPRTRTPWLVPEGLGYLVVPGTTSETTSMPPRSYLNTKSSTRSDLDLPTLAIKQPASRPSKPLPIRSVRSFVPSSPFPSIATLPSAHSAAYITSQLSAVAHIAAIKPRSLHRILPFRWKTHFGTSLQSVVCRDDLSDFVLSRLRKRLIQQLLALGDEDTPYFIPFLKSVEGGPYQMGAVLWAKAPWEGYKESDKGEPETYTIVRVPGTNIMVPIYNLRLLLGLDGVQELDNKRGGFWRGKEMVAVKARGKALELLAALWRLMVYLGGEAKGLREWRSRTREERDGI